jgi:S1-C subfamily serine protease
MEGGAGIEAGAVAWVEAAAAIRPSVHSVWGSRPVLGGARTAFVPLGTAFVLTREGVLLTGAHVVARADSTPVPRLHVLVQTDTGSTLYPAAIRALDMHRDLALLRIPDTTLVPVRWAGRRAPMGTPVATLGFGLPEGGIVDTSEAAVKTEFTVVRRFSAGHSSSYRTLMPGDPSTNVLEVDLFLFPGVSGGPTFGLEGGVLGVNRGHRRQGDLPTSYGHVTPRLVVGQFLAGPESGVDTARIFGEAEGAGKEPAAALR